MTVYLIDMIRRCRKERVVNFLRFAITSDAVYHLRRRDKCQVVRDSTEPAVGNEICTISESEIRALRKFAAELTDFLLIDTGGFELRSCVGLKFARIGRSAVRPCPQISLVVAFEHEDVFAILIVNQPLYDLCVLDATIDIIAGQNDIIRLTKRPEPR